MKKMYLLVILLFIFCSCTINGESENSNNETVETKYYSIDENNITVFEKDFPNKLGEYEKKTYKILASADTDTTRAIEFKYEESRASFVLEGNNQMFYSSLEKYAYLIEIEENKLILIENDLTFFTHNTFDLVAIEIEKIIEKVDFDDDEPLNKEKYNSLKEEISKYAPLKDLMKEFPINLEKYDNINIKPIEEILISE